MRIHLRWSLFILLCILGCACQVTRETNHRTDKEMVSDFQSHRAEFSKLLAMFQSDKGLQYFSKGHTRPEDPASVGVTQDRLKAYQEMFSALGLDGMGDVSVANNKDEVWFFTSTQGPRESTFKHYAFVLHTTRGVVEDLDTAASKAAPYRHIEGDWYLALDDAD